MLSANDSLLRHSVAQHVDVQSYGADTSRAVEELLLEAEDDITRRLLSMKQSWTKARLDAVMKDIRTINRNNFSTAADTAHTALDALSAKTSRSAVDAIAAQFPDVALDIKHDGDLTHLSLTFKNSQKPAARLSLSSSDLPDYMVLQTAYTPDRSYRSRRFSQVLTDAALEDALSRGYKGIAASAEAPPTAVAAMWTGVKNHDASKEYKVTKDPFATTAPQDLSRHSLKEVVFSITSPTAASLQAIVSTDPVKVGSDGALLFKEIFKDLSDKREALVLQSVRLGMVEGQSTEDIVRRLTGTRLNKFKDGMFERSRRATRAMVRTAVNHTSNKAAGLVHKANKAIIKGEQWTATLDTRTSPVCQALDGRVFKVGVGQRPPAHVNCRSFTVPVMKSFRELGLDIDGIPESTRASMDGQVPGSLTYPDWLKENPSRAVTALGPTRAALFLEGKVSIAGFVDKSGAPLPLAKLVPAADLGAPQDLPGLRVPSSIDLEPRSQAMQDKLLYGPITPPDELSDEWYALRTMRSTGIADRVSKQVSAEDIESLQGAFKELEGKSLSGIVETFLRSWDMTSAGNRPLSVFIQQAARKEFDLGSSTVAHLQSDTVARVEKLRSSGALTPTAERVSQKILRTMHADTQEFYRKQGVREVVVYRGMVLDDPGLKNIVPPDGFASAVVDVRSQPLSSYSLSLREAVSFANTPGSAVHVRTAATANTPGSAVHVRTVVTAKVPVERLLSTGVTGFSSWDEAEVVVLGGLDQLPAALSRGGDNIPESATRRLLKEAVKGLPRDN